jgi:hypothetical protein
MKQKFLMLLAVVLLSCVSAFAQSGNNEPLKGDVNEDGKVDVADIAAVINIMKNGGGTTDGKLYFYVGTEKPTSLSQATVVDSYPAEYTFTNPSTTEKCYVYVLTNADKTVNFYDPTDPNTPTVTTEDTSTISGYKITSTGGRIAKGGDILIKITDAPMYYWYVGTLQPTDPANPEQNTGLNKWASLGTSLPTSSIKVSKVDSNYELHTWYIAAPTDANFTLYNATNVASNEAGWNKTTFTVGSVSYTLWTSKSEGYQAVGYLHK